MERREEIEKMTIEELASTLPRVFESRSRSKEVTFLDDHIEIVNSSERGDEMRLEVLICGRKLDVRINTVSIALKEGEILQSRYVQELYGQLLSRYTKTRYWATVRADRIEAQVSGVDTGTRLFNALAYQNLLQYATEHDLSLEQGDVLETKQAFIRSLQAMPLPKYIEMRDEELAARRREFGEEGLEGVFLKKFEVLREEYDLVVNMVEWSEYGTLLANQVYHDIFYEARYEVQSWLHDMAKRRVPILLNTVWAYDGVAARTVNVMRVGESSRDSDVFSILQILGTEERLHELFGFDIPDHISAYELLDFVENPRLKGELVGRCSRVMKWHFGFANIEANSIIFTIPARIARSVKKGLRVTLDKIMAARVVAHEIAHIMSGGKGSAAREGLARMIDLNLEFRSIVREVRREGYARRVTRDQIIELFSRTGEKHVPYVELYGLSAAFMCFTYRVAVDILEEPDIFIRFFNLLSGKAKYYEKRGKYHIINENQVTRATRQNLQDPCYDLLASLNVAFQDLQGFTAEDFIDDFVRLLNKELKG